MKKLSLLAPLFLLIGHTVIAFESSGHNDPSLKTSNDMALFGIDDSASLKNETDEQPGILGKLKGLAKKGLEKLKGPFKKSLPKHCEQLLKDFPTMEEYMADWMVAASAREKEPSFSPRLKSMQEDAFLRNIKCYPQAGAD